MKTGKWLAVICLAAVFAACKEDDRDDTILEMSRLTGKNWYYNGWLGDKNSFEARDLLEVIRFEQGGALKCIDYGGRREYVVGKWYADENNQITLDYGEDGKTVWHVQHSGDDYIRTIVNAQGSREYTTDPGYLRDLTADAFLVNEYTSGNLFKTYLGADVRGNIDVREGQILLADGHKIALQHQEYYWTGKNPFYVDFNGKEQEVRFYLRIGKNTHLKLRDSIYGDNLPRRLPAETDLSVSEKNGSLRVMWNPYAGNKVYYRIEILNKEMDLTDPYFISRIQNAGSTALEVTSATAGEINRIGALKSGDTYIVRLTALLYEPGIDPWNDHYGYANVQAVAYYTKKCLKD